MSGNSPFPSDSLCEDELVPRVSVVMPVYNGERFLAEAIESILTQTFSDFELIIVDDGSTDGSAEIIRAHAARDARIRVFQLGQNRGKADARNIGIDNARGDYITAMDCDDVSMPERLAKQADFLADNPEIGGVGTWGRTVNRDLTPRGKRYTVPNEHALIAWELFFGEAFLGATVMFRRDILTDTGGYERGRRYVEDLELLSRLLFESKIRFANLTEDLLLYRIHDQPKFDNPDIREQRFAATRVLYRRNLERVWNETPIETFDRCWRLRYLGKLSWSERRAAKRDIKRLIDSMIAAKWIEPGDRHILIALMNRRLEGASPRLWQMFCHWYRYRIRRQILSLRILQVQ